jgi:hypothetical protein
MNKRWDDVMSDEEMTSAVFKERLNSISLSMTDGFSRIEKAITSLEVRIRTLETTAFSDVAVQKAKIDMLLARADENKSNISGLHKTLGDWPDCEEVKELVSDHPQVMAFVGITKWLLGIFGVMVIGLLWAIFTHSVNIVVNP